MINLWFLIQLFTVVYPDSFTKYKLNLFQSSNSPSPLFCGTIDISQRENRSLFCDLSLLVFTPFYQEGTIRQVYRFTILRISKHCSVLIPVWKALKWFAFNGSGLNSSMVRFQFPLFCG